MFDTGFLLDDASGAPSLSFVVAELADATVDVDSERCFLLLGVLSSSMSLEFNSSWTWSTSMAEVEKDEACFFFDADLADAMVVLGLIFICSMKKWNKHGWVRF